MNKEEAIAYCHEHKDESVLDVVKETLEKVK
mgnify:CR=1 FL=1